MKTFKIAPLFASIYPQIWIIKSFTDLLENDNAVYKQTWLTYLATYAAL